MDYEFIVECYYPGTRCTLTTESSNYLRLGYVPLIMDYEFIVECYYPGTRCTLTTESSNYLRLGYVQQSSKITKVLKD